MAGVIYLMTNVAMPGMVKIGKTDSVNSLTARLRDLYNTSVPLPFECSTLRQKWTMPMRLKESCTICSASSE